MQQRKLAEQSGHSILSMKATIKDFVILYKFILKEQNLPMITSYDRITEIISIEGELSILKNIRQKYLETRPKMMIQNLGVQFFGSEVLINSFIFIIDPKTRVRAIKLSGLQEKMSHNKNIRLNLENLQKKEKITWVAGPKQDIRRILTELVSMSLYFIAYALEKNEEKKEELEVSKNKLDEEVDKKRNSKGSDKQINNEIKLGDKPKNLVVDKKGVDKKSVVHDSQGSNNCIPFKLQFGINSPNLHRSTQGSQFIRSKLQQEFVFESHSSNCQLDDISFYSNYIQVFITPKHQKFTEELKKFYQTFFTQLINNKFFIKEWKDVPMGSKNFQLITEHDQFDLFCTDQIDLVISVTLPHQHTTINKIQKFLNDLSYVDEPSLNNYQQNDDLSYDSSTSILHFLKSSSIKSNKSSFIKGSQLRNSMPSNRDSLSASFIIKSLETSSIKDSKSLLHFSDSNLDDSDAQQVQEEYVLKIEGSLEDNGDAYKTYREIFVKEYRNHQLKSIFKIGNISLIDNSSIYITGLATNHFDSSIRTELIKESLEGIIQQIKIVFQKSEEFINRKEIFEDLKKKTGLSSFFLNQNNGTLFTIFLKRDEDEQIDQFKAFCVLFLQNTQQFKNNLSFSKKQVVSYAQGNNKIKESVNKIVQQPSPYLLDLNYGDLYKQYSSNLIQTSKVSPSVIQSGIRLQNLDKSVIRKNSKEIEKKFSYPILIGGQFYPILKNYMKNSQGIKITLNYDDLAFGGIPLLYDEQEFTMMGEEDAVEKLGKQIQEEIQKIAAGKKVLNCACGQQYYKTISIRQTKDKFQRAMKTKIVLNPQIYIGFEIQYLRKNLEDSYLKIMGIHGSYFHYLVDSVDSVVVFASELDLKQYYKLFPLMSNLLRYRFCYDTFVNDDDQNLFEEIKNHIMKMEKDKKLKKVRYFIMGSSNKQRQFVWNVVKNGAMLSKKNIDLEFIVVYYKDVEEEAQSFEREQKKWFVEVNGYYKYYKEEGNYLINEALRKKTQDLYFDLDHIDIQKPTHEWKLGQKMLYPIRYGHDISYTQSDDKICYKLNGMNFTMHESQYKMIKHAEKVKTSTLLLSLPHFHIDLGNMQQTNQWNDYRRDLQSEIDNLSLKNYNFMMVKGYSIKILTLVDQEVDALTQKKDKLFSQSINMKVEVFNLDKTLSNSTILEILETIISNKLQVSRDGLKVSVKYNSNDSTDVRLIRNLSMMLKEKSAPFKYPPNWSFKQRPKDNYYFEVSIPQSDSTFTSIGSTFPYKIVQLIRVQNYSLYRRFQEEKQFLEELNDGKKMEVLKLFHGTRATNPDTICADKEISFNINFSSEKNYMGRATYFALNPQYSHAYRWEAPMSLGRKIGCMLLCEVITGDSMDCPRLHCDYRDTQMKVGKKIRYESMTGTYDGSKIYTVYKNNRAYPLYKIMYTY